jgi:hypothetical protein
LAHRAEKKRKEPMKGSSAPPQRFRIVSNNHSRGSQQHARRWVIRLPQQQQAPNRFPAPALRNNQPHNSNSSDKETETSASCVATQAIMPRIADGINQYRCQHLTKKKGRSKSASQARETQLHYSRGATRRNTHHDW